ncbi:hypothetical protein EXIGLDRAFT_829338 [Exidia glandulosa HHB12029]|uniref:F-box domain-containing protein n=1 Tax=Exidia glandulosa HHB12029 TaxID=1314781 RepID=A0A166BMF4_EXIGL|nr:hypothetical protein EXIGLDRAFT_829338 [Exidia glandulosa HHB12029]
MAVTAIRAVLERLDAVQRPLDALDALSIGPSVRACTRHVESVQDTLTNTAHGLDAILARTRGWRNMLAQVNRLSDELLACIFLLVCDDAREHAGPWPGCAVARVSVHLAHVCSRWRSVAFRGAALWTDVQLPQTVDSSSGDCDRLLALSSDLPCSVSIAWRDIAASNLPAGTSSRAIEYADAILPALQAHAERLTGLSVVFDESYSDAALKVLATTAPRLSRLCFGHHIPGDGGRTVFTSPLILPLDMPVLSHLSLNALDSSILPSFRGTCLHELCLGDMDIQGSDLEGVLTRNTTLRSLSLRNIGLRGTSPPTRWAVPELQSLVVTGMSSDSLTVLRRSIALSHIASIDMTYDPIGALIGYHNTRRVDFPWAAYLLSGIGDVHTPGSAEARGKKQLEVLKKLTNDSEIPDDYD